MDGLDWGDLRHFLSVTRAGSLSGAARALKVSQSTMSRRLAAMEKRCGARLLERNCDGYHLTALGEAVLTHAERIDAEVIAATRKVQGRDVALSGLVRVTTVDVLASGIIAPAVAALQRRNPAICVDVLTEARALSLPRREADIAIRMMRFEDNSLFTRRLGHSGGALYASPAYLSFHGSDLTANMSAIRHGIVTVLPDQSHLPDARWLERMVPGADIRLRSNDRDTLLAATRAGIGIAALPRYLADRDNGLIRLENCESPPEGEIWLGVHKDLRQMPRVRAMIEAIEQEIKAQAHLLAPERY